MRKHVAWYVRGMYDNSTLCRQVNHAQSPAEVEDLLWRYLEKIESGPPPADESYAAFDADAAFGGGAANGEPEPCEAACNGSGASP